MRERVEVLIEGCARLLFPGSRGEEPDHLDDASVAIQDGKIVAVGSDVASRYSPDLRIDGRGRLLTPGFVDSHTHLVFAGDRSGEFAMRPPRPRRPQPP